MYAGYLFVTGTRWTPNIIEPGSQDLLITIRLNTCVARIKLGLKSHRKDWIRLIHVMLSPVSILVLLMVLMFDSGFTLDQAKHNFFL